MSLDSGGDGRQPSRGDPTARGCAAALLRLASILPISAFVGKKTRAKKV